MDSQRLQLILDASQATQGAGEWNAATNQVMQSALRSTASLNTMQSALDSVGSAAKGVAVAYATMETAKHAKDVLELGARYETLGVVMNVVGRNAGFGAAEMRSFDQATTKMGISMVESRNNLTRMAAAQLDLSKASQMARVAQDAAVVANINSSEAFERLIQGIVSGQPRILHTMGIFADFGAAEKKWAEAHGKTLETLSQTEKVNIRFNATMEEGAKRAGAYEAAMNTAGKQLKSSERYWDDLKVKVSSAFQPEFTAAVKVYAEALKGAGDHAQAIAEVFRVMIAVGEVAAVAYGSRWVQSFAQANEATATMMLQVARGNAVMLDSVAAQRGAAAAAVERAQTQRAASAAIVTALEAERAEIRALQVAERQRLGDAATRVAGAVPMGQLAPLGAATVARDNAAVVFAMKARADAQAALIALSQRAVVSDAELAGAARAVAVADAEVAVAEKARAAVMAQTTIVAQGAAIATGAFSKALAFLGGPIGATILLAMGVNAALDKYGDHLLKAAEQTDAQKAATEKALDTERKRNQVLREADEEGGRREQKFKATLQARQEELGKLTALNAHYQESDSVLKALDIRYDAMIQKSNDAKEHKGAELAALNAVTDALAAQKIKAEELAESRRLNDSVRDVGTSTDAAVNAARQEAELIGLSADAAQRKRIAFEEINAKTAAQVTLTKALERADAFEADAALAIYDNTLVAIQANKDLALAQQRVSESLGTQALREQADALKTENDALRQGEATRETYLIGKRYELDVVKALQLSTAEEIAARITAAQAVRDQALAHVGLTNAQKAQTKSAHELAMEERQLQREQQQIANSLEHDLLRGIEQFTTQGLTSFRAFFHEVQSLSLAMVGQLDNAIAKMHENLDKAANGDSKTFDRIEATLAKLEKLRQVAGIVSAITSGGSAGYGIGHDTGSTAMGVLGGGASGAASGFAVAGPMGAVVGALSGVAGGLLGAAAAQQEAARRLQAAADAFKIKETQFLNAATGGSAAGQLQTIQTNYQGLIKELNDLVTQSKGYDAVGGLQSYRDRYDALGGARDQQVQKLTDDFWAGIQRDLNALQGPSGSYANAVQDIMKAYTEAVTNAQALGASQDDLNKIEQLRVERIEALDRATQAANQRAKDDLTLRQLSALGLDDEARALQHQLELQDAVTAKRDAEYMAMLKQTQAMEDERIARDKATQAAKDAAAAAEQMTQNLASFASREATLRGDTRGAAQIDFAEQQRREMKGYLDNNASSDVISRLQNLQSGERGEFLRKQQVDALTAAIKEGADRTVKVLDAQAAALRDQLRVAQATQQTAQQTLSETARAYDSLTKYRDSLVTGALSPLSPADQLSASRAQLQSLYTAAMNNDKGAAQNFGGSATDYLTHLRDSYGSTATYAQGFGDVQKMTDALTAKYGAQQTNDQKLVDAANAQVDLLTKQIDATQAQINTINTAADRTIAAITNMSAAQVAGLGPLFATLQGALSSDAALQAQGVTTGINSVASAILALASAVGAGGGGGSGGGSGDGGGILTGITGSKGDAYGYATGTTDYSGVDVPGVQITPQVRAAEMAWKDALKTYNDAEESYMAGFGSDVPDDAEGMWQLYASMHGIAPVPRKLSAWLKLHPEGFGAGPSSWNTGSAGGSSGGSGGLGGSEVPPPRMFASGGDSWGGSFIAGERGPELVTTGGYSHIFNAPATAAMQTDGRDAARTLQEIATTLRGIQSENRRGSEQTIKRLADLALNFERIVQLQRFSDRNTGVG